jgi:hypothetical protein
MCPDEVQGTTVPAVNISEGGIADTRGFSSMASNTGC